MVVYMMIFYGTNSYGFQWKSDIGHLVEFLIGEFGLSHCDGEGEEEDQI